MERTEDAPNLAPETVEASLGGALAPTRARPCWAFENSKFFELVCEGATNPFEDEEERWLEAIDVDPDFEIPLESRGYPSDVKPGMELTLVTARGHVQRTVRGVSGQPMAAADGLGLRYTIRLDGLPVGPALAIGDIHSSAVLADVSMRRAGPTPLRTSFEEAMLAARRADFPGPTFGGARVVHATTWTDPLDASMGRFVANVDSLQPPDDESIEYGGLGYTLRAGDPIEWIVSPEFGLDGVSIEHVVDLEGDGTHELIAHASFETSETLLLIRRGVQGFEVQPIYWAGC